MVCRKRNPKVRSRAHQYRPRCDCGRADARALGKTKERRARSHPRCSPTVEQECSESTGVPRRRSTEGRYCGRFARPAVSVRTAALPGAVFVPFLRLVLPALFVVVTVVPANSVGILILLTVFVALFVLLIIHHSLVVRLFSTAELACALPIERGLEVILQRVLIR